MNEYEKNTSEKKTTLTCVSNLLHRICVLCKHCRHVRNSRTFSCFFPHSSRITSRWQHVKQPQFQTANYTIWKSLCVCDPQSELTAERLYYPALQATEARRNFPILSRVDSNSLEAFFKFNSSLLHFCLPAILSAHSGVVVGRWGEKAFENRNYSQHLTTQNRSEWRLRRARGKSWQKVRIAKQFSFPHRDFLCFSLSRGGKIAKCGKWKVVQGENDIREG